MALAAACGGAEVAPQTPAPTPAAADEEANTFTVTTSDGVSLAGHTFGDVAARDVVILSHMYPADQRSWFPFARELATQGYLAITFDFRGYGESEGEKQIDRIDRDVEAALAWAHSNAEEQAQAKGDDPEAWHFFLVGASMGGTASLIVAAREEVAGVVTLSAPEEFQGLDAEDVLTRIEEPKLFLAAEGDSGAAGSARRFMDTASQPKDIHLFSGNAHGTDMLTGPEGDRVKQSILEFPRTNGAG